jgi:hypothetical protein
MRHIKQRWLRSAAGLRSSRSAGSEASSSHESGAFYLARCARCRQVAPQCLIPRRDGWNTPPHPRHTAGSGFARRRCTFQQSCEHGASGCRVVARSSMTTRPQTGQVPASTRMRVTRTANRRHDDFRKGEVGKGFGCVSRSRSGGCPPGVWSLLPGADDRRFAHHPRAER